MLRFVFLFSALNYSIPHTHNIQTQKNTYNIVSSKKKYKKFNLYIIFLSRYILMNEDEEKRIIWTIISMKKDNILSSLITFYYITSLPSIKYPPLSLIRFHHPFSSPFSATHTRSTYARNIFAGNFCRNPQLYTPHEKTIFRSIQLRGKSNNNIYFSSEFTHTSVSVEN
jgi:hypothetical protein